MSLAQHCPAQEASALVSGEIILPTLDVVLRLPGSNPVHLQWSCPAAAALSPPSCVLKNTLVQALSAGISGWGCGEEEQGSTSTLFFCFELYCY